MQGDPPVLEAVCFHAQQCAEKYLKAVLEENGLKAARTHDLLELLDSCAPIVPGLFKLEEEASLLSSCAVEVRYPGVEPDHEEASLCLAAAAAIRALLKDHLGLS